MLHLNMEIKFTLEGGNDDDDYDDDDDDRKNK